MTGRLNLFTVATWGGLAVLAALLVFLFLVPRSAVDRGSELTAAALVVREAEVAAVAQRAENAAERPVSLELRETQARVNEQRVMILREVRRVRAVK